MARNEEEIKWRTIVRRINEGECTPIISYRVGQRHFSDNEVVVRAWADELGYPLVNRHNLAGVAQYASHVGCDPLSAKEEYLDFLKQHLLNRARAEPESDQEVTLDILVELEAELPDLSYSEVAARLGYPHYEHKRDNPLCLLAELPLPIYLTTSFASSLEEALRAAGKAPRPDLCCWHQTTEPEARSVFEQDPDYRPSVKEPLVFHLHGLDTDPASLVLSENDYLDFLVRVSRDPEAIPRRVTRALADSSLLLIGYRLEDWDFRVLFRGLIGSRRRSRQTLSLSIQLDPDPRGVVNQDEARRFLECYFGSDRFDIFWGSAQEFMQELWARWEG